MSRVALLGLLLVGCTASIGGGGDGDSSGGVDGGGGGADAGAGPSDGAVIFDAASPTTLTVGQSTLSLTAAGTARTAILYVPANATSASQLAIALHGNGGTAENFLAGSGLKALADSGGTVLVVPQGIQRDVYVELADQTAPNVAWDAYNTTAQGNLDIPLLDALRAQLTGTGQIDTDHVFVIGYSQGGYMSFAYGMAAANSLSCAAVLAATSPFGGGTNDPWITSAPRQIPVSLQIGTNDAAYSSAEATNQTLQGAGFPTQWNPIQGAGHSPIPGSIATPWDYCSSQSL